jgi:hypothetical protein
MVQVANTYDTYDDASRRETFLDIITRLTPAETPLYSNIGNESIDGTEPVWQTENLAAPDLNNARVEGDIYTFDPVTGTARVKNYTQIFSKRAIVSNTQEAVKKAGKTSESAHLKIKLGQEIKIDMEAAMLSNQASVAGSSTVARRLAGLRAWISTNDLMGTGGASGGYNTSTGAVDAATNGTQRAFTKSLMDQLIGAGYIAGGNGDMLMVAPYVKQVFSTFMSDANVAQTRFAASKTDQVTIVGAADQYLSDYGIIEVVPNRQMARAAGLARNAFLLERDKLKKLWLRPIAPDEADPNADGKPIVINGEMTLQVKNEAALAVVADIFGTSASA